MIKKLDDNLTKKALFWLVIALGSMVIALWATRAGVSTEEFQAARAALKEEIDEHHLLLVRIETKQERILRDIERLSDTHPTHP